MKKSRLNFLSLPAALLQKFTLLFVLFCGVSGMLEAKVTTAPVSKQGEGKTFHQARMPHESPANQLRPQSVGACDTLFLLNGSTIIAKVVLIAANEVRYQMCDSESPDTLSLARKDIREVAMNTGIRIALNTQGPSAEPAVVQPQYYDGKVDPVGIVGLASAFLAVLVTITFVAAPLAIGLAPLAVVLGAVSISRHKKRRFTHRSSFGFAVAGFVIGLLEVILMVVVALALLMIFL